MKPKYFQIFIALCLTAAGCSQLPAEEGAADEGEAANSADVETSAIEPPRTLEDLVQFGRGVGAVEIDEADVPPVVLNSEDEELSAEHEHEGENHVLTWHHDWMYEHQDSAHSTFGQSVRAAGDVNGDGYDDFIIGEVGDPFGDEDVPQEGAAYVFYGDRTGPSEEPVWEFHQNDEAFGYAIETAGDVNDDGYDDVLIGAPLYNNEGEENNGKVYLFLGSEDGLEDQPEIEFVGANPQGLLGLTVAGGGDINGDGVDDFIVGAPGLAAAAIFEGDPNGVSTVPSGTIERPNDVSVDAFFGFAVDFAGDVNGDGHEDVVVGAPFYTDGEPYEGAILLFEGGPDGLADAPTWQASPNQGEAYLGYFVTSAGDVNGDGYDEVVAGAPNFSTEEKMAVGAAYGWTGSASGLSDTIEWQITGEHEGALLGQRISGGGDVNGDGFDDVLVANPHKGQISFGGELYLGGNDGLEEDRSWEAIYEGNADIGATAQLIGDIDDDGHDDMIIGAPDLDAILLYYGASCFDADRDGYMAANLANCSGGSDCEDLHDWVYPEAEEICDGMDSDCNGEVDEGCDDDGDGYCDADMKAEVVHADPSETCPRGTGDCNDDDPDHSPATPEECNFKDDNCNGRADEEPGVCGGEEAVCFQGGCFGACEEDADCSGGEKCYDGRCSDDPCANVECRDSNEECFFGKCQRACEINAECRWDDKECIDGRCAADPCDEVVCGSEEACQDGECVPADEIDDDPGADAGTGDDAGTGEDENTSSPGGDDGDEGGCSTSSSGLPPAGALYAVVIFGGLMWRRRKRV